MRGVPLHVYYIYFWQYVHPIGSDRPPWAAGEFFNCSTISWTLDFNSHFKIVSFQRESALDTSRFRELEAANQSLQNQVSRLSNATQHTEKLVSTAFYAY